MAARNYYELLGIDPSALPEEIKRAFRQQITRYHPDKVQHLGKEFQDMAADRASEITEAYRVLSNVNLRAAYDRERGATPPPAPPRAESVNVPVAPRPSTPSGPDPRSAAGGQFTQERSRRDEFVRKASIERFRQVLSIILGDRYNESEVRGFDLARLPKSKLFSRAKGPSVLARFVSQVDSQAVIDAWTQAAKAEIPSQGEICVFLIGPSLAPSIELTAAMAKMGGKFSRASRITLIPVDLRDWEGDVPSDGPDLARTLLARLRTNS